MWARFAYFYVVDDEGKGHVQSLILGAVLFNAAMVLAALGVMGDLLAAQRTIAQRTFERVRRIELQLGVAPSHYEPGAQPTGHAADDRRGRRRRDRQDRGARGVATVSPAAPVVTVDAEGTVTGNTYDKYGSTNPVVRRLMAALRAHARRAVRAGRPRVAARRRLRRGRADAQVGRSASATAASSASTSTTRCCTPSGRSARRRTSATRS